MATATASVFKAVVQNGRLHMDEPVSLPEGTVLDLVPADYDDLDDEERAKLHASLERAWAEEQAGLGRSGESFLNDL